MGRLTYHELISSTIYPAHAIEQDRALEVMSDEDGVRRVPRAQPSDSYS